MSHSMDLERDLRGDYLKSPASPSGGRAFTIFIVSKLTVITRRNTPALRILAGSEKGEGGKCTPTLIQYS